MNALVEFLRGEMRAAQKMAGRYQSQSKQSEIWSAKAEQFRDAANALEALPKPTRTYKIEHDGFEGTVIGSYVTREDKKGVVLQQIGTRVVHVYGEKWLK